jgi:hypothetical protein
LPQAPLPEALELYISPVEKQAKILDKRASKLLI